MHRISGVHTCTYCAVRGSNNCLGELHGGNVCWKFMLLSDNRVFVLMSARMKLVLWVWLYLYGYCYHWIVVSMPVASIRVLNITVAFKNLKKKKWQPACLQLSLPVLLWYEGGNCLYCPPDRSFRKSVVVQSVAQRAGLSVPAVYWNKWSLQCRLFKVFYCNVGQLCFWENSLLTIRYWLATFKQKMFTNCSHILSKHHGVKSSSYYWALYSIPKRVISSCPVSDEGHTMNIVKIAGN